jgi:hypothetical protein
VEGIRAALSIRVFVGVPVILCSILESDELKDTLTCSRRKSGCLTDIQGQTRVQYNVLAPRRQPLTRRLHCRKDIYTLTAAVAVQVRYTVLRGANHPKSHGPRLQRMITREQASGGACSLVIIPCNILGPGVKSDGWGKVYSWEESWGRSECRSLQ